MSDILRQILTKYPKVSLFEHPSPVLRLERLEKKLDIPAELYIKRDDLLRPLFGNKIRYLEYIFGHLFQNKYNAIIHAGGPTSNYMAQLSMAGAMLHIPVYIIINGEEPSSLSGNLLINRLFARELIFRHTSLPTNSDSKKDLAERLRRQGLNPFVIDYPMGNFLAHLGYMSFFNELLEQTINNDLPKMDHICLCSGFQSYIGLVIAACLTNVPVNITAFRASKWNETGLSKIFQSQDIFLENKIAEFTDFLKVKINAKKFDMTDDYVGPGYAVPYKEVYKMIRIVAETEGILLDPVYTGKAFYGMIENIKNGRISKHKKLLFIHTGGIVNNFTYSDDFKQYL